MGAAAGWWPRRPVFGRCRPRRGVASRPRPPARAFCSDRVRPGRHRPATVMAVAGPVVGAAAGWWPHRPVWGPDRSAPGDPLPVAAPPGECRPPGSAADPAVRRGGPLPLAPSSVALEVSGGVGLLPAGTCPAPAHARAPDPGRGRAGRRGPAEAAAVTARAVPAVRLVPVAAGMSAVAEAAARGAVRCWSARHVRDPERPRPAAPGPGVARTVLLLSPGRAAESPEQPAGTLPVRRHAPAAAPVVARPPIAVASGVPVGDAGAARGVSRPAGARTCRRRGPRPPPGSPDPRTSTRGLLPGTGAGDAGARTSLVKALAPRFWRLPDYVNVCTGKQLRTAE